MEHVDAGIYTFTLNNVPCIKKNLKLKASSFAIVCTHTTSIWKTVDIKTKYGKFKFY